MNKNRNNNKRAPDAGKVLIAAVRIPQGITLVWAISVLLVGFGN
jgi:hypothetical protein